jgi:hypothetical protein
MLQNITERPNLHRHMLSDQSKLDTHTVSHNRCQQPLEAYLLVKGINLIKELHITVPRSNRPIFLSV